MASFVTDDGLRLWYEETGTGPALVFVHEFGGDSRSWAHQLRSFSGSYRCIAYNARGYPPSDVPPGLDAYGQTRARDDLRCLLDRLEIPDAHLVGLSMGAYAVLHVALTVPGRVRSMSLAGIGYGAHPTVASAFRAEIETNAEAIHRVGMRQFAETWGRGPTRIQFERKDPKAFERYLQMLGEHSVVGSANTLVACQGRRPSLYALTDEMRAISVPTLILVGDEDEPALEASILLKRCIGSAGLVVVPRTGHLVNLEEPAFFNHRLRAFLRAVQLGTWVPRDKAAWPSSIWGPAGQPSVGKPIVE